MPTAELLKHRSGQSLPAEADQTIIHPEETAAASMGAVAKEAVMVVED